MRIVITAQGETIQSQVDPRFGRARGFIVTDENGNAPLYLANDQNLHAASGAGIQAAQHVIEENPDCIITGNVGPKAFRVLSSAQVKIFIGASGTVADALQQFRDGALHETAVANVDGHW